MPEYRQFRGGIFNTSKPRHGFDGITITKRDLRNRGKTWKGSLIVKRSAIFNKDIKWARDMSRVGHVRRDCTILGMAYHDKGKGYEKRHI